MASPLPIDEVLDDIRAALQADRAVVINAPPGSGKTTRVPRALLAEPWLAGGQILMLEPRRVAARAAAEYMAATLGETVGEQIGVRTRDETRVGPRTRIQVITEGVLTRIVQDDPSLAGVGCVIFDEFHERSLAADTALAFCLETQAVLRADLRLIVMSATIDVGPIASLLGAVRIVRAHGREHPIETRYRPRTPATDVEVDVAGTIGEAVAATDGDVLAFLPGTGWIRRTERELERRLDDSIVVTPLYGMLPPRQQDAALRPHPEGRRKVVLATALAETSVTIDGVRVVVDSGLSRRPVYDPASGMTRLETTRVSRATADQRRGRAGRQAPGVCYRLWSSHDHDHLRAFDDPEILVGDLTTLRLELARWGASSADELSWLDPPPLAALNEAADLLTLLGALDDHGRITPHGRRMADLGTEPRLAHLMLEGADRGLAPLAIDVAALLSGRDPLAASEDPDIRLRLDRLARGSTGRHKGALEDVRRSRSRFRRQLGVSEVGTADPDDAGQLISIAYPERIAVAQGPRGSFHLANGKGATLPATLPLAREAYLAVATVTTGRESRIGLAAPLDLAEIEALHGGLVQTVDVVAWDRRRRDVVAEQHLRLDKAILLRRPLADPDREQVTEALLDGVRREGLGLLPWTDDIRKWQARVAVVRRQRPDWPDMTDENLLDTVGEWLGPHLHDARRRRDLDQLALADILAGLLGWRRARDLDRLAPTHITVPSGSRIPLDYLNGDVPVLEVRLQEMFGCAETPRAGELPVLLHLLSPAHRPMQVTSDLASFWANTYPSVRAELRGRYPKHHWPEDPLTAAPTNRAKRRNH